MRPGVADGGMQFRPLLGLVLGLEQMPHGAETVSVVLAPRYSRNMTYKICPVRSTP